MPATMITQFFKQKTSDESAQSGDINNKASLTCNNLFKFRLDTLKMAMLLLQFGVLSVKNLQLKDHRR